MRARALGAIVTVASFLALGAAPANAAITCHKTLPSTGITTVPQLVAALSPGQTGCIRAGTYTGDVALNKSVTLTSYGGENALIRGRVAISAAGAKVTKLMLDGTNSASTQLDGSVAVRAPDVTLRDNDIRNPTTTCVSVNADGGATVVDRVLIERNRIHDCGNAPTSGFGYGLLLDGGNDALVRHNLVYDNAQSGILLLGPTRATVTNNTVDGNSSGVTMADPSFDTRVRSNVTAFPRGTWNIARPPRGPLTGTGNLAEANCGWTTATDTTGGFQSSTTGYTITGNVVARPGYEPTRPAKNFEIPSGTGCAGYGAPSDVARLAPDTTIESGPTVAGTSMTVEFSSSKPGSTFECRLDGPGTAIGAWTAAGCVSPRTYGGLQNGSYTFHVRAKVGSSTDATPASAPFSIGPDTTPPETSITANPSNPSTSTSASFSFTSPEANTTFECKVDTQVYATCTSPKAYANVPQGAHTFSVRAKDAAGNVDATPASYTWTVDSTPNCTPDVSGNGYGTFTSVGGIYPAGCWRPYSATSPWNRGVPLSPRLSPSSSVWVDNIVTNAAESAFADLNQIGISNTQYNANDYDHPTYYSQSGDPWFRLSYASWCADGEGNGAVIQIPQQARFAGGADRHMSIVSQPQDRIFELYGDGVPEALPTGGTQANPATLAVGCGGIANIKAAGDGQTADGTPVPGAASTAALFGGTAGIVRQEELAAGRINHALKFVSDYDNRSFVYPAGWTGRSRDASFNDPPMGTWIRLNMSEEAINALAVSAPTKTIYRALAEYGAFFGDTGSGTFKFEGGDTYTAFSRTDPWIAFAHANEDGISIEHRDPSLHYFRYPGIDWRAKLQVIDPCEARGNCA